MSGMISSWNAETIGRIVDYLRWVSPALVFMILYPLTLVGAVLLSCRGTAAWLRRRHVVQDRHELQAEIADRDVKIRDLQKQVAREERQSGRLRARLRENHALVSQLAANYSVVDTESA